MTRKTHPKNVHGASYVEEDCYLSCGVPEHFAPELFASVMVHEQCFVNQQPESTVELNRMVEVLKTQDFGCARYGGRDDKVRLRLLHKGSKDVIDE